MYKPGDIVLYVRGDKFELGEVVKPNTTADGYFVRYYRGGTVVNTPTISLHPIQNIDEFQVIRKDFNNAVDTQKARRIAIDILEKHSRAEGESRFNLEDSITEIIEEGGKLNVKTIRSE